MSESSSTIKIKSVTLTAISKDDKVYLGFIKPDILLPFLQEKAKLGEFLLSPLDETISNLSPEQIQDIIETTAKKASIS